MKKNFIATYLCFNPQLDSLHYPQISTYNQEKRQALLWQAVIAFFYTSLRVNPEYPHIFFINRIDLPPKIKDFLIKNKVQIKELANNYAPPKDITKFFGNVPFRYDICQYFSQQEDPASCYLLLDCDCVWLKNAWEIFSEITRHGLLAYDVYNSPEPEEKIHNLSRFELGGIFKQIDPNFSDLKPIRFGGEIIGGRSKDFKLFINEIDYLYQKLKVYSKENIPRLPDQTTLFDNDELMSSYAYSKLGVRQGLANKFISRLWTSILFRNISKQNLAVAIWHLPYEKQAGIPRLAKKILKGHLIQKQGEFNKYLGKLFGIPNLNLKKIYFDLKVISKKVPYKIYKLFA